MQLRLGESAVALIILLVFVLAFAGAWFLQARVEQDLPAPDTLPPALQEQISRYEVERLKAQIKQIRSDTAGSLFWLKMVALFVTVGGAVGGYLVGLRAARGSASSSRTARASTPPIKAFSPSWRATGRYCARQLQ